jgi:hypothetical protein
VDEERRIPEGCPVMCGNPEIRITKNGFVAVCKGKQRLGKGGKHTGIYVAHDVSHNIKICRVCGIGVEVRKGTFRRCPTGLTFIHPFDIIKGKLE